MENASRYWQLMRLSSAGGCQIKPLPEVQVWLQQAYADLLQTDPLPEPELQAQILSVWQAGSANAPLAQLSLRCFVTHQIRQVCIQLEQQFGSRYGFSREDLFPLVLDDDGQPIGTYQPVTVQVIESYDPRKARLSTWTDRLVKNHPEINRLFLDRGLYRASDWAILNDTTPEQLQRILGEYHQCLEAEVKAACHLLSQYHRVYRRDRILQRQSGQKGRCEAPSIEQLQRMVPDLPPKIVLSQLQALAGQLREYRIYARGGMPSTKMVSFSGQDADELDRQITRTQLSNSPDEEDTQSEFLQAYRTELRACLSQVLSQVVQIQMAKLQKRKPPVDQAFVRGLQLFHCEGLSMGAIATKLSLKNQVQVTRLLDLKQLRSDVRLLLIPQIGAKIRGQALAFISVDRLNQIDQTLEQVLSEEVEQLIAEAASEAQIPKGRTAKSLFAHQLCQIIHTFISHE